MKGSVFILKLATLLILLSKEASNTTMESKDYVIRKTFPLDQPELKTKLKYPSTVADSSDEQNHLRNYPAQKNSPITFIRVKPNEFHRIANKNNTKTINNINMIGKSIKPTYRVMLLNKNPNNITSNFQSQIIRSASEISKNKQKYDIENNITLEHDNNQHVNEFYKKETSDDYKGIINDPNFEKVKYQAAHNSNVLKRAGKLKTKINKKLINEITNLTGSKTKETEIYSKKKEFQRDASNDHHEASNLYNNRNDDENNNVMQETNSQNIHRTDDSSRNIQKAKEKSVSGIGTWYKNFDSDRKQLYSHHCIPHWYSVQFENSFLPKIYYSTTNSKVQNQKDILFSNVGIPKFIADSHGKNPINNMQFSTENAGTSNLFGKNSVSYINYKTATPYINYIHKTLENDYPNSEKRIKYNILDPYSNINCVEHQTAYKSKNNNSVDVKNQNTNTDITFNRNKYNYSGKDTAYSKDTLIDLNNFYQNAKENYKREEYEDITNLNDINDYSLQPSITTERSDKKTKNTYSDYLDIVAVVGFGTDANEIKTDPFNSAVNINVASNEEYIDNTNNNVLAPISVDDSQNSDSNKELINC